MLCVCVLSFDFLVKAWFFAINFAFGAEAVLRFCGVFCVVFGLVLPLALA